MHWLLAFLLAVAVGYGVGFAFGMNPSTPTDWLLNLSSFPHIDEYEAEEPDTLVVLQHGLWRSASSLGRLERALRDHGYDVLNTSYPSTQARIEEHAARLAERLEAHLAERARPPARIAFVGHSMGGLVIRSYLARDDAVEPWAVVFIGTPHRGAVLATKRKGSMWFDLFMGDKSALQLVPGDPLYGSFGPVRAERIGVVVGARGDGEGWNADIPGDDDGTVGAAEARLDAATDTVELAIGHTRISFAAATIRQILAFLRTGHFEDA